MFGQLRLGLAIALVLLLFQGSVFSSDEKSESTNSKGVSLGREQIQHVKVGLRITAGGPMKGIVATAPIPMEWPEQQVKIVDEDISPNVRKVDYRTLEKSVKQLVITIPNLRSGEKAHALLTLEVRGRAVIIAPKDPSILKAPKRVSRDIRKYLSASPYIESRNRKVQDAAKQATKEKETTWEQVEAVYDFVRENVQYRESKLKGAVQTLSDGVGDCEAMTSLFIAMCRAAKVPARVVWVTDHCYPEFHLVDDEGNGHWIPCQVAGTRAFGSMPDIRPILQKGDNIRIPEKKKGERYASVFLKAKSVRGGHPRVEEVLELVSKSP